MYAVIYLYAYGSHGIGDEDGVGFTFIAASADVVRAITIYRPSPVSHPPGSHTHDTLFIAHDKYIITYAVERTSQRCRNTRASVPNRHESFVSLDVASISSVSLSILLFGTRVTMHDDERPPPRRRAASPDVSCCCCCRFIRFVFFFFFIRPTMRVVSDFPRVRVSPLFPFFSFSSPADDGFYGTCPGGRR